MKGHIWHPPMHIELLARIAELLLETGETPLLFAHIISGKTWQYSHQPRVSGQPDILTATHIYEVKRQLRSQNIQKGVGQLLFYDQDWPGRILVLIGHDCKGMKLRPYVKALGIEIRVLPNVPLAQLTIGDIKGE